MKAEEKELFYCLTRVNKEGGRQLERLSCRASAHLRCGANQGLAGEDDPATGERKVPGPVKGGQPGCLREHVLCTPADPGCHPSSATS